MRHSLWWATMIVTSPLIVPGVASATFHFMSISEIAVGVAGDPTIQYVELRQDLAGQNHLVNTRLTAFDANGNATELLLSDHAVSNGTSGANVLYATAGFAAATGVAPDFVIPAGLVTPTGMICWGAPEAVPPDPNTWDLNKPNNYVDCVAYGGFTAPTRNASGTPSTLGPGDGTHSLTRIKGNGRNGSNDVDFALAPPNVCNNTGVCSDLVIDQVCGDADGNGAVTVTDGVQTLRAAADLSSSCTLARCDVNGSGTITVTDGVQVLRAAADLPIRGTCEAAN